MLDDKKHAMEVFYEVHAIPSKHMIPASISIPLVNRAYELITSGRSVQRTIEDLHDDLAGIFGGFNAEKVASMAYAIARKIGYRSSDEGSSSSRWVTKEEYEDNRERRLLLMQREYEEQRMIRTAHIRRR